MIWLIIMPAFSCLAFMWDGIFIGATAARAIRNGMIWACASFYVCYFAFRGLMGIQALYMAYFAHLIARDIYMTVTARRQVFYRIPQACSHPTAPTPGQSAGHDEEPTQPLRNADRT